MVYISEEGDTAVTALDTLKYNTGWYNVDNTDFQNLKNYWRARDNVQHYVFKFTWAEEKPLSGNYFKVKWVEEFDKLVDIAGYIQRVLKLLNKALTGLSGVVLFSGEGTILDYDVPVDEYQDKKMLYITGFEYMTQTNYELGEPRTWITGIIRHYEEVHMPSRRFVYDSGSSLIWNVSSLGNVSLWLYFLGPHIYNAFPTEVGITSTIKWRFKTDEDPPRYLLGSDEYWITHGFPNGRRYRIWYDAFMKDIPAGVLIYVIFRFMKKIGLGAKFATSVIKLITAAFNLADSGEDDSEILDNLQIVDNTADSIWNKFKKAYSPRSGAIQF